MSPEVLPIVRHLIVCEDILYLSRGAHRVSLINLISSITSNTDPAYPYRMPEFCVFSQLAECRATGEIRLEIAHEDTGDVTYESDPQVLPAQASPLEIIGLRWRIRSCSFPDSGLYSVSLWYNDSCLAEQPLILR